MLQNRENVPPNPVFRLMNYVAGSLLDFLFPRACVLCRTPIGDGLLCPGCRQKVTAQGAVTRFTRKEDFIHLRDTPCFDQCLTGWNYSEEIKEIIRLMKYKGYVTLCEYMGNVLGTALYKELQSGDIIMPVPLHIRRRRERTYNQSYYIARGVAGQNPHLALMKCIRRIRYTAPQAMLTGHDRQNNVTDAFSVRKSAVITGKNIVLVDDVITTGATVQNCSAVLRAAGAANVTCISVARPYK